MGGEGGGDFQQEEKFFVAVVESWNWNCNFFLYVLIFLLCPHKDVGYKSIKFTETLNKRIYSPRDSFVKQLNQRFQDSYYKSLR